MKEWTEFYQNFTKFRNIIKRTVVAYPLRDFHEIHSLFQDELSIKISMALLKGLQSLL